MAKDRNLKFGVQIDFYEYYSKHAKLGDKRAWLRSRDLLFNSGFLDISAISKATNYPKVVNVDDGSLRAELPS